MDFLELNGQREKAKSLPKATDRFQLKQMSNKTPFSELHAEQI